MHVNGATFSNTKIVAAGHLVPTPIRTSPGISRPFGPSNCLIVARFPPTPPRESTRSAGLSVALRHRHHSSFCELRQRQPGNVLLLEWPELRHSENRPYRTYFKRRLVSQCVHPRFSRYRKRYVPNAAGSIVDNPVVWIFFQRGKYNYCDSAVRLYHSSHLGQRFGWTRKQH